MATSIVTSEHALTTAAIANLPQPPNDQAARCERLSALVYLTGLVTTCRLALALGVAASRDLVPPH